MYGIRTFIPGQGEREVRMENDYATVRHNLAVMLWGLRKGGAVVRCTYKGIDPGTGGTQNVAAVLGVQ